MAQRFESVLETYRETRPLLRHFASLAPVTTIMDVGCGDGFISRYMARDLGAREMTLVDLVPRVTPGVLETATFRKIDVCDQAFLSLKGRGQVVTCFLAFHEFLEPERAAKHLIQVLPPRGMLCLVDRSEGGWKEEAAMAREEGGDALAHYENDLRLLGRTGLGTSAGITQFWWNMRKNMARMGGRWEISQTNRNYTVSYQAP